LVRQGIHNNVPAFPANKLLQAIADRCRSPVHRRIGNESNRFRVPDLFSQKPDQIGIGHRSERVLPHAGVRQQIPSDEQVAVVDRAAVFRESRTIYRDSGVETLQQRLGHRSDVPLLCRIERRAVLEEDLVCALTDQPIAGRQGFRYGVLHRRRAALQRDHRRLGVVDHRTGIRQADVLNHGHAVLAQHQGQVRGPGHVIADGTDHHHHRRASQHRLRFRMAFRLNLGACSPVRHATGLRTTAGRTIRGSLTTFFPGYEATMEEVSKPFQK
jgi:hypothetical protein